MLRPHGRLKAQKRHLGQNSPAQLAGLFGKWLDLNKNFGTPKRLRLFSPSRMFWLFLFQVMSPDGSCREVLRGFLAWLAAEEGKTASVRTTAYCKARAKLPLKDLQKLNTKIIRKISAMESADDLWCGRRVKRFHARHPAKPMCLAADKKFKTRLRVPCDAACGHILAGFRSHAGVGNRKYS